MRMLSSRTAVVAVVLLFAWNGLVIGVYASSIPTLRARFNLDSLSLAALFFLTGAAAIASMQVCGRLADRVGARRVALTAMLPLVVAALGFALAPSYPVLLLAGVALGLGNGGIDVTMNAIAVQVEKRRERPIMSFFHGTWSIGNLAGAGSVVLVAQLTGWTPDPTVNAVALTTAAVGVAAFVVALRIVPETELVVHTTSSGEKVRIPKSAYLLGIMAIAFGLGEGASMDWSALHVTTVAHVDPTTGALGVTMLSAFMVVIRLVGDFLVRRFGRRVVVRFGGTCAAIGYLTAATMSSLPLLLIGWALVGLGMGMIAPQVYAVAGHQAGGRGLAVVVTFGYAAFLITPGIIGGLVSAVGIQHTMFLPAVLLLGLLVLARVLPPKGQDPSVGDAVDAGLPAQ